MAPSLQRENHYCTKSSSQAYLEHEKIRQNKEIKSKHNFYCHSFSDIFDSHLMSDNHVCRYT